MTLGNMSELGVRSLELVASVARRSITISRCIGSSSAPQASSVPHSADLASVDFG
jgi:hypothetical protein